MKEQIKKAQIGIATLAALTLVQPGQAQSADALLDKLVEKGVLTSKEAKELREETDAGPAKSYQVKSGIPDWVNSLKISGDLRGRFEAFYASPEDADGNDLFKDRARFRYRARLGAVATLLDNFEAGIRLTSSEPNEGFGGDPISGNTTWANNGSYKFVYIDRAYGKWSPTWGAVALSTTIGKMENPFMISDLVFDADYSPEGIAQTLAFNINDQHSLKFTAAGFVLDEVSGDSDDPHLLGASLRWDSKFTPALQLSAGISGFLIDNEEFLADGDVPNVGRGNSRTGGELTAQFNPIVADLGITFNVPEFPMYNGPFPIRVGGEYMENLAEEDRNQGFAFGASFGKSGKKGLWDLSYRYKYQAANYWYEEFPDSDFGVLRPTVVGGELDAVSYASGTNLRGHIFRASYSPSDAMTLGLTYFLTDLIGSGGAPDKDELATGRLQVDAMWRF